MRAVIAIALCVLAVACVADARAASAARSYQIDPEHSGRVPGGGPAPPLKRIWSRRLGGQLSFPVVAGGRVFVTAERTVVSPERVFALDRATGRVLWSRTVDTATFELAYGDGRVFLTSMHGLIRALDARTGAVEWI